MSETLISSDDLVISHTSNIEDVRDKWKELQKTGNSYIYQTYEWVRIAYETLESHNKPLIIHGSIKGKGDFLFPLVLEQKKLRKILRFPGGDHANLCTGLYSPVFLESANKQDMEQIVRGIGKLVGGTTVLWLNNQPTTQGDFDNPLLLLKHNLSSNVIHNTVLPETFDETINNISPSRKRKNFRRQVRKAEGFGGHELFYPETREEILASLADYYVQKRKRLQSMGVRSIFDDEKTQTFLETLALTPAEDGTHLLKIVELKVGGITRSMYGSAIHNKYWHGWFNSVTYDEFSTFSPGEMILYLLLEKLTEEGYKGFDLGIGKEPYKISWTENMQQLYTTTKPLSLAATPFSTTMTIKQTIKSKLRNNDKYWHKIRAVRNFIKGKKS